MYIYMCIFIYINIYICEYLKITGFSFPHPLANRTMRGYPKDLACGGAHDHCAINQAWKHFDVRPLFMNFFLLSYAGVALSETHCLLRGS